MQAVGYLRHIVRILPIHCQFRQLRPQKLFIRRTDSIIIEIRHVRRPRVPRHRAVRLAAREAVLVEGVVQVAVAGFL